MKKPWYSFLYVKTTVGKVVWGIIALLLSLVLLVAIWVVEEPRMEAHTANWEARSIEKGAEIFANNCYTCHGVNGEGMMGRAPALNSRYFFENRLKDLGISGSLHDFIEGTVAAGRPSNTMGQWSAVMPTWGEDYGGPLRNDQVTAVADFIMNWESEALQQTPEEDPWQPFINAPTTGITGTVPAISLWQWAVAVATTSPNRRLTPIAVRWVPTWQTLPTAPHSKRPT
jgi:mono/diheme cytochrome c family protein